MRAVLLDAFRKSRRSINSLSRETGIGYSSLYLFVHKGRSLMLPAVSALADALDLELRPKGKV